MNGGDTPTTIGIVGCGRAGGAIGLALRRAGEDVVAAWSRSRAGRRRAQELLGVPVLEEPWDVVAACDLAVLAVPDDTIAKLAPRLAGRVRPGSLVVHTSGATSVEVLAPVREAGGRIGSLHPLQSLPDPERGSEALRDAAVAVTCADEDREELSRIVSAWGGHPFPLPDEAKVLYHAGAVFASNAVVACLWAAKELLEEAGVDNAMAILTPLVRSTVENVAARGPEDAITGPVVRGDLEAVRGHVAALAGRTDPEPSLGAYRALAELTAAVAARDPAEVREAVGP